MDQCAAFAHVQLVGYCVCCRKRIKCERQKEQNAPYAVRTHAQRVSRPRIERVRTEPAGFIFGPGLPFFAVKRAKRVLARSRKRTALKKYRGRRWETVQGVNLCEGGPASERVRGSSCRTTRVVCYVTHPSVRVQRTVFHGPQSTANRPPRPALE